MSEGSHTREEIRKQLEPHFEKLIDTLARCACFQSSTWKYSSALSFFGEVKCLKRENSFRYVVSFLSCSSQYL